MNATQSYAEFRRRHVAREKGRETPGEILEAIIEADPGGGSAEDRRWRENLMRQAGQEVDSDA